MTLVLDNWFATAILLGTLAREGLHIYKLGGTAGARQDPGRILQAGPAGLATKCMFGFKHANARHGSVLRFMYRAHTRNAELTQAAEQVEEADARVGGPKRGRVAAAGAHHGLHRRRRDHRLHGAAAGWHAAPRRMHLPRQARGSDTTVQYRTKTGTQQ